MVRTRGHDTSPSQPLATRCCPPTAQQHRLLVTVTHRRPYTDQLVPRVPRQTKLRRCPGQARQKRGGGTEYGAYVVVARGEPTAAQPRAVPSGQSHPRATEAAPARPALYCPGPNQPRALRNRRLHTSAERVSATRRHGCVKTGMSHTTSHALRRPLPLAHTYAVARQGQSETLTMKAGWDSGPPPPPLRLTRSHFRLADFTTSRPSPTPPAAGVFLFACLLGAVGGLGITTAGMVATVARHDTYMHASLLVRGR